MLDDTYYNILMESDSTTIENLYMVNKTIFKICSNMSFWINKFNQENLPFLYLTKPNTVGEWLNEYKYLNILKVI